MKEKKNGIKIRMAVKYLVMATMARKKPAIRRYFGFCFTKYSDEPYTKQSVKSAHDIWEKNDAELNRKNELRDSAINDHKAMRTV
jgi:hypothetical protein